MHFVWDAPEGMAGVHVSRVFRFWQARAVESFLRGVTSYADQVFLLRRGLLEVVCEHVAGVAF